MAVLALAVLEAIVDCLLVELAVQVVLAQRVLAVMVILEVMGEEDEPVAMVALVGLAQLRVIVLVELAVMVAMGQGGVSH